MKCYFHDNSVVLLKMFNVGRVKKCSLQLKGGNVDKLGCVAQTDGDV